MIASLVPEGVTVVETDTPWMWQYGLLPEEVISLGATTVEKRRREFTAGRNCARRALAALGLANIPILPGKHREPLWPAGIVGSITHCTDYCAAAIARCEQVTSIGIDVEHHVPLSYDVQKIVCTDRELRWIQSAPNADRIHWETLFYSAKESVYKAWFPVTQGWLGFDDAELVIDPHQGRFIAYLRSSHHELETFGAYPVLMVGRFRVTDKYIFTVAIMPARGESHNI